MIIGAELFTGHGYFKVHSVWCRRQQIPVDPTRKRLCLFPSLSLNSYVVTKNNELS